MRGQRWYRAERSSASNHAYHHPGPSKKESTVQWYLSHVQKHPVLTHAQSQELFYKMHCSTTASTEKLQVRNHLVQSNLRLVISIAKGYQRSGLPFEELIQEGNLGLIKSVERFDPEKGFRFSTYATWWIRQAIQQHVLKRKRTIRIPAHAAGLQRKMISAAEDFRATVGSDPTVEDLAEITGASETVVRATMESSRRIVSLSEPAFAGYSAGGDDPTTYENILQDAHPSPFDNVSEKELVDMVRNVMNDLSPKEKAILRLRFGLVENENEYGDYSMTEEEHDLIVNQQEGLK